MLTPRDWRRRHLFLPTFAVLALTGCGPSEVQPVFAPPTEVSVVQVQPASFAAADELPGRVTAFRVAEIRPQVGGIIQRRLFEQGSEVLAGQPLFQINPAPFRADAQIASAALQKAQAVMRRARVQQERLRPLVDADAISRQSYDDAVATHDQAAADVAQNRATLQRRRLDQEFATVRSPISGRVDQAVMTEGALAGVGDTAPLATVQQIDRVYVDVRQPATRLDALRAAASAGIAAEGATVEILSADGTALPVKGRLLFSGISVDPGTGEVIARVEVPNPGHRLLPGMFVRARLPRTSQSDALTVPMQAVSHDPAGKASVNVVDARGHVLPRRVVTGDERGGRVLILRGLKAGEQVVVEGQDRIRPNTKVKAVAWRRATNNTGATER